MTPLAQCPLPSLAEARVPVPGTVTPLIAWYLPRAAARRAARGTGLEAATDCAIAAESCAARARSAWEASALPPDVKGFRRPGFLKPRQAGGPGAIVLSRR